MVRQGDANLQDWQVHGHLLEVRADRGETQSIHKLMLRLHGGMVVLCGGLVELSTDHVL